MFYSHAAVVNVKRHVHATIHSKVVFAFVPNRGTIRQSILYSKMKEQNLFHSLDTHLGKMLSRLCLLLKRERMCLKFSFFSIAGIALEEFCNRVATKVALTCKNKEVHPYSPNMLKLCSVKLINLLI